MALLHRETTQRDAKRYVGFLPSIPRVRWNGRSRNGRLSCLVIPGRHAGPWDAHLDFSFHILAMHDRASNDPSHRHRKNCPQAATTRFCAMFRMRLLSDRATGTASLSGMRHALRTEGCARTLARYSGSINVGLRRAAGHLGRIPIKVGLQPRSGDRFVARGENRGVRCPVRIKPQQGRHPGCGRK